MDANYFEITAKSKSGKNIDLEMYNLTDWIQENDDLDMVIENDFYPSGHYDLDRKPIKDMYHAEFCSEFYDTEDMLVDLLKEFTNTYPDIVFEIIQTFEGDSYYRHIIADGEHEEHQAEIVYPANERLKYFD